MSSPAESFARAWQLHQANALPEAEATYRRILEADPTHADAWCFLGAACQAQGKVAEAERSYRQALHLVPDYGSALNFLGILLAQKGQLEEAAAMFEQLLRVKPQEADACNNLGLVRAEQGRLDEAIALYRRALALRPDSDSTQANLEQALQQQLHSPASLPGQVAAAAAEAHACNQRGLALAQQGRLDEAVANFRQAVQLQPAFADAHLNLGSGLFAQQRYADAIACYRQALQLQPDGAEAHYNLGVALEQEGQRDEAAASYRQALRCRPDHLDAQNNLGNVLKARGDLEGAIACYREVLRRRPDFAEVLVNLGNAHGDQEDWDQAEASYQQALRLKPQYAEAHNGLGIVRTNQERFGDAIACYRQALHARPDYAEAHNNLGNALRKLDCFEEAIPAFQEALRLRPAFVEALNNLGSTLRQQGKLNEAMACFRESARLQPDVATTYNNWGVALSEQGDLDGALAQFEQALQREPAHAEAHLNRALVWLLRGDFARGWPEYEWRWRSEAALRHKRTWNFADRPEPESRWWHKEGPPRWDGSDLAGRTILLYAEQGLGDVLQFVRYAPLLRQRAARVVVECPAPLLRLLANSPGIDQVVAAGQPLPTCDVQAPLLSLPGLLRTTLQNVPATVPYLAPPADLLAHWRHELAGRSGFKVGIAWQGNPAFPGDRWRSVPLTCFEPLARLPGVTLVGLQKGAGEEQVQALQGRFAVEALGGRLEDLADTAALVRQLDLVVTVDTAVAHLAGALGVPVWAALPAAGDWRWLRDRDDSPWYPTMHLFRQQERGNWQEVFERIAAAVAAACDLARPRQGVVQK